MKRIGLLIAAILTLNVVHAQNHYHSYGNGYQGYNANTGSTWSAQTQPNGTTQGIDSHGNTWQYNPSTGDYYNYGTGEHHNRRRGY